MSFRLRLWQSVIVLIRRILNSCKRVELPVCRWMQRWKNWVESHPLEQNEDWITRLLERSACHCRYCLIKMRRSTRWKIYYYQQFASFRCSCLPVRIGLMWIRKRILRPKSSSLRRTGSKVRWPGCIAWWYWKNHTGGRWHLISWRSWFNDMIIMRRGLWRMRNEQLSINMVKRQVLKMRLPRSGWSCITRLRISIISCNILNRTGMWSWQRGIVIWWRGRR